MRILLITPYFYPHKGGSQQYAEELYSTLMKRNPKTKVDVLCYNTDKSKSVEEYKGFTIYRVPCFQVLKGQFAIPNYFDLWKTLNKLFKTNRYDYINSHTRFFESSWWTPFVARYFHTKSLLTDHCASHPTHKTSLVTKLSYTVDRFIVPFFLNQYDHITVTNSATQKFMQTLTKKEANVIYGGVDTKYFKASKKTDRRKILNIKRTFSKKDTVITFVGRMIYSKGPQILLESANNIIKKYPNTYFIFGGDGPLYKELSKKANSHIFFTGSLSKRQIKDLFSQTDIVVHPSIHHEGFPNVILEAGAAGCAVIATNMGGTYEIITPETGILIRPSVKSVSAKIEYLIKNKKERMKLGKNLEAWVTKRYDWGQIASDYKTYLDQKMQKKSLLFPAMRISSVPRH